MAEAAAELAETTLPVRRVYEALRQRLMNGDYAPGQKLPPERELVEEFGVSRMTIAKAMAQLTVEDRIHRFRGRGTFAADTEPTAKPGAHKRIGAHRVTFISPGRRNERPAVHFGVLAGLHEVMNHAGYDTAIDFYSDLDQHLSCLSKAADPQAAGFVVWPEPGPPVIDRLGELLAKRFPLVLVDIRLRDLDCDHVIGDNVEGAAAMVAHLASQGHRRITYLTEPADRSSLRDRLTGFLRGALEAGLPAEGARVVEVSSFAPEAVAQGVKRALDVPQPPTALFASHDTLAMAAYRALRRQGLRVPADISLAGYDDIDAAQHFAVPLTTVSQNYFEMMRVAGRVLLERMSNPEPSIWYQQLIAPRLVERQSTAPPASRIGD